MQIYGLGHTSRAGKDSLANFMVGDLIEYAPQLKALKRGFAFKLKQICWELYSWDGMMPPEYYDTPEGEKARDIPLPTIGKTPVEIWVAFGTPAVREQVYQPTWIDYLLKTDHNCDVLIIPDVRFLNEAEAIKELGGTLVKVVRPGYGPRNTVADRALLGYTGWDYVVGGTGTMEELHRWANGFVGVICGSLRMVQTPEDRAANLAVECLDNVAQEPATTLATAAGV